MIRVFGITGTNGKTTASWMLRNILEQTARCGLIGTIEYIIGETHYKAKNTTPGKDILRSLLAEMSADDIKYCVMEVSSHGLDQGRTDRVHFSGAGFTNLSRDHLDYHKNMEQYYLTKKKLFMSEKLNKTVNIDDTYGTRLYKELVSEYGKQTVKSISLKYRDADFYGKIISQNLSGSIMEVYENGSFVGNVKVGIPGRHFASDALLAMAMAHQEGMAYNEIFRGIETLGTVAGRMEKTGSADDTLGIIDYAHTPDSLEKLLVSVAEMKRGKLLCVFGCGGFRDKGKRKLMGEIAGRYSDYCIITSDNPRGEPPENIAQAIEEGLYPTGCGYCVILNRYQAIRRAVSLADKWDVIVVAGKGHETYQISGGECIPFDDKKVLKELLEKKYEKTYNETDRTGNRRPYSGRR